MQVARLKMQAGAKLQVARCKLQGGSCKMQVTRCKLHDFSYIMQDYANFNLQVARCKLKDANCKMRAFKHKLQDVICKIKLWVSCHSFRSLEGGSMSQADFRVFWHEHLAF